MKEAEARHIEEDMVDKGVLLETEQHQVVPSVVVGGQGIEDHWHKGVDVLDTRSLSVEVGDDGSFIIRMSVVVADVGAIALKVQWVGAVLAAAASCLRSTTTVRLSSRMARAARMCSIAVVAAVVAAAEALSNAACSLAMAAAATCSVAAACLRSACSAAMAMAEGGGVSGDMEGRQKRRVRKEITGSQESLDTILEHKQASIFINI